MDHRISGVAGREQYLHLGSASAHFFRELGTIDFGHDNVGKKQGDFWIGIDKPQRLTAPSASSTR